MNRQRDADLTSLEFDDILSSVTNENQLSAGENDGTQPNIGSHEPSSKDSDDAPVSGVTSTYLAGLKEKLSRQMKGNDLPACYKTGTFWICPPHPFFAMRKSCHSVDGPIPDSLYHPVVFLWLPHLLSDKPILCQNLACKHFQQEGKPMTVKGWNDNPIARRVVDLDGLYYIMTKRVECATGCGQSVNLYDPSVLKQLEHGLASAFPAFLTHRSGIDKSLMTLIRAGIAHHLSSRAWSKILQ